MTDGARNQARRKKAKRAALILQTVLRRRDRTEPVIPARQPALSLLVRDAVEADHNFIFATWLNHFRDGPVGKLPIQEVYFREQHLLIEKLLGRCKVLIAANPEAEDHLFGWLVGEVVAGSGVVHYAFVKSPFRKSGVGRKLVTTFEDIVGVPVSFYTHLPPQPERALRLKPAAVYDPYIAFR